MKLERKDVIIRDWKQSDEDIFRFWNIGYHKWMDFDAPYYSKMNKEEIESLIIKLNTKQITNRKVIASLSSDKLLGTVSWYWQSKASNWKSIGIAIYDSNNWGKGVGFQALRLWVDYMFKEDKDLKRLDLRTWSGNFGMINLALKLGFKEEARFRNARFVDGKVYDSIGMGILKEEWKNKFS